MGLRERRCMGCKVAIVRPMLACRPCWFRLPTELRDRINSSQSSVYIPAAIEAVAWFRNNREVGNDGDV